MPASNVSWPTPLTRLNPWYPGQFGVPGTDNETGLRLHSTGTVFYVDPNAVGVSDQRDGTDPNEPLATVAAALTHCQAYRGDVVAVMANNYWYYSNPASGYNLPVSEEVTVSVPGVRLVGVNLSGSNGVTWMPASNGGTCIRVYAMDVLVEGFVFTEGTFTGCDAILADWDNNTRFGDNLTVRHCVFDDTVDTAINLDFTWYAHIHDNHFWRCDEYGIYVDPAGNPIAYSTIHDNLFYDVATGAVSIPGATYCKIYRNNVYNAAAQGGGAATNEGINTTGGIGNLVEHNTFSCVLPPVGAGDYADLNSSAASDAWINNFCMNGETVTNP